MSLRVSFELEESDLKHFRLIMKEARKAAANTKAEAIVAAAKELLARVDSARVPAFIRERLTSIEVMIAMLADHEWRLPAPESTRVLNALAYFSEPEDLIPDHIPGLGFLDDAIMIELVVRELRHEMDAYRDFCEFRARMPPRPGVKAKSTDITREDWLSNRRKELQSRMRRRRKRTSDRAGGTPPVRLL
jgi:uncharacterized membrane protein YkvA (DUF1232 family)